jgi:hypothetical protein
MPAPTPLEVACNFFSCGPAGKTEQDFFYHIGVLLCQLVTLQGESQPDTGRQVLSSQMILREL